ncbi:MAG: flagellar brake protein [Spongiibacteraceae bacterium]|nr:flagellar brake protein [Spongiibacteraceae bacterium]
MIAKLIDRYKALRYGNHTEEADPALNRVYLVLHQQQRSRRFIEIMVEGDDLVYQSMVLSLDPEDRTILIDELFPKGFVGLAGQQIHVAIRQDAGRKIEFNSAIIERHSLDDAPLYVIGMPESLDLDQRRGAYRLPVSTRSTIEPCFTAPDSQDYKARLRNVSSSGVCLEIDGDEFEPLHYDDHLSHVAFDFAGQNIDCALAVRSVVLDENKNKETGKKRWLVGAEFLDLSPVFQRVLEKSIMQIQRDRIKYSADAQLQQAIA